MHWTEKSKGEEQIPLEAQRADYVGQAAEGLCLDLPQLSCSNQRVPLVILYSRYLKHACLLLLLLLVLFCPFVFHASNLSFSFLQFSHSPPSTPPSTLPTPLLPPDPLLLFSFRKEHDSQRYLYLGLQPPLLWK